MTSNRSNLKRNQEKRLDWRSLIIVTLAVATQPAYSAEIANSAAVTDVKVWIQQGESLREKGELIVAQQQFDVALRLAGQVASRDTVDYAAAEAASGYNLFLLNRKDIAEKQLRDAFQRTAQGPKYLHVLIGQYLAALDISSGEIEQALAHIEQALALAKEANEKALELSLELMRDSILVADAGVKSARLLALGGRIDSLPNDYIKAKLQLKLAQSLLGLDFSRLDGGNVSELSAVCYAALANTVTFAEQGGLQRLQAEALGALARLYRLQERTQDALILTERAIAICNQHKFVELLAPMEAQQGELLRLQGDQVNALRAYTRAVDDLLAIRADLPIALPDGKMSIDALIDPIHRNYVDLLLQTTGDNSAEQSRLALAKAIESMEAIKEADMQDFFLGRCEIGTQNKATWQSKTYPDAVIVYPILLKNRIELLVKNGAEIYRRTVDVDEAKVKEQAANLTKALHAGKDYRNASKQLYQWLYQPIKQDVDSTHARTLIYVPDRSLRAVPFSALHDGKQFMVERYAIVTLPGLTFQDLNKQRQDGKNIRTLVAGLSKPDGSSIDRLPENVLERLIGKGGDKTLDRTALIKELSLPNIEQEIDSVASPKSSTMLLNNRFTAAALKSDIATGDYAKVHIASHGYFGKNAKESFVMAYDQNLSLLDFESSLGADQLRQEPIDLLTLSACETAEGDDRMLLGFSGLAVKNNVLSAVGSLWSINDQGAMEFMRLFYQGMGQSLNKAEAMRQAQVAMIKSKRFRHPFFWAPFILIGSWQ